MRDEMETPLVGALHISANQLFNVAGLRLMGFEPFPHRVVRRELQDELLGGLAVLEVSAALRFGFWHLVHLLKRPAPIGADGVKARAVLGIESDTLVVNLGAIVIVVFSPHVGAWVEVERALHVIVRRVINVVVGVDEPCKGERLLEGERDVSEVVGNPVVVHVAVAVERCLDSEILAVEVHGDVLAVDVLGCHFFLLSRFLTLKIIALVLYVVKGDYGKSFHVKDQGGVRHLREKGRH